MASSCASVSCCRRRIKGLTLNVLAAAMSDDCTAAVTSNAADDTSALESRKQVAAQEDRILALALRVLFDWYDKEREKARKRSKVGKV